jgi:hypothetical protein
VSKEVNYVTEEVFQEWMGTLYEATDSSLIKVKGLIDKRLDKIDDCVVVLEALTRGMRLPDELDIAGQTYVKKGAS